MGAFQAFELADLTRQQSDRGSPYLEFLRRPGMSLGLYRLPVGGTDLQHPHAADEVYVVLRGRATLRVEGEDHPVQAGSVVSVDQGREHRFVDIVDELELLVVFAPAETPDA
jgi:mannose-6-phosphate isomerase-like protein (cupin superfamily)